MEQFRNVWLLGGTCSKVKTSNENLGFDIRHLSVFEDSVPSKRTVRFQRRQVKSSRRSWRNCSTSRINEGIHEAHSMPAILTGSCHSYPVRWGWNGSWPSWPRWSHENQLWGHSTPMVDSDRYGLPNRFLRAQQNNGMRQGKRHRRFICRNQVQKHFFGDFLSDFFCASGLLRPSVRFFQRLLFG